MPYDRLTRRLGTSDRPTVRTLPDGSVDHYCTVAGGSGTPLETREAFGREILGDRTSIDIAVETTRPGGQAINTATQMHALGGDVTCYGHLDAPVFDSLPFKTVSMGAPSQVYVFAFTDRDVLLVDDADVADWTIEALWQVSDRAEFLNADVICCSNWVSMPGLEHAFHHLGDADGPRVPFIVDPGDIVGRDTDYIETLLDALGVLQGSFDVVYSANRKEVRATAAPVAGANTTDAERLAAIQEATGITAAVMHARDAAVAATQDGRTRVANYRVAHPVRHTGGGDRFTGGLAHALACGWDWEVALACGNACAVYYVDSGETGTSDAIRGYLENRGPPT